MRALLVFSCWRSFQVPQRPARYVLHRSQRAIMSSGKKWPGETSEAYPDIFTTIPKQPNEKKEGQLTETQLKQYFEEGFVLVENFFKPEELQPVRQAIKDLVEDLAHRLYDAGKIKILDPPRDTAGRDISRKKMARHGVENAHELISEQLAEMFARLLRSDDTDLYREYGLFQRLTMVEKEFPGANIILHRLGRLPQSFRDLWSNERLLNVIEQLIGPDIAGHPVWNLRTKTPQNEASTVPWHQDVAYLDNDSYKIMQPTAWIPLLDSNETNGCMQVIRNGHKTGKIVKHQGCWRDTWYLWMDEDEMERELGVDAKDDAVMCSVPYGGLLLFSNVIPHRSLNNLSKDIRWSLDLRWQNPSKPFGVFGIKQGVPMRSSTNPNVDIDWEAFDNVNRHATQKKESQEQAVDEWDTTNPGPWMTKWEITHHNRHTAKLSETDRTTWQMP